MINDFFTSITEFIFCENSPQTSDIILVPGNKDLELIAAEAARLYNAGYAKKILFSGGKNGFLSETVPTEGCSLKELAVGYGVPVEDIIVESRAKHSFQNAVFTKRKLDKMGIEIKSAILLCRGFHSRRALLSYQSVFGPKVHFSTCIIPGSSDIRPDNWLLDSEKRDLVLGEVAKIGNYLKKHLIQIEQSTNLSLFQKYAGITFAHKKRLIYNKNSSEYFSTKKKILSKKIPPSYKKIVYLSLDEIFQAGFFRDFIKHIVPGNGFGCMESVDMIKKITTYLASWDILDLLNLWEAYVQVNSKEACMKIKQLKENNFYCILCGYEYDQFLEVVARISGIPLCAGTMLEYSKNICNGEVSIPSYFFDTNSNKNHPYIVAHTIQHTISNECIYVVSQQDISHIDIGKGYQKISKIAPLVLY